MWHHQQKDRERHRAVQGDRTGPCLQRRRPANRGRNNHGQEERSTRHPPASSRSQEQLRTGNLLEPLLYLYEPGDSRTKTVWGSQCASPALPPLVPAVGALLAAGVSELFGASWLPTVLGWAGLPALFPFQEKKTKALREGLF